MTWCSLSTLQIFCHVDDHLPASFPDNSIMIEIVVSAVRIVLFMRQVSLNRKTRLQSRSLNTPRRVKTRYKLVSRTQFSTVSIVEIGKTWFLWCRSAFSFGVFLFSQTSVALLWWWAMEDFTTIGTLDLKESYYHWGPSPLKPNQRWTWPDDGAARAQAPGCQRNSCMSVRRGRGGDRYNQRRT